ncbi:MAG: 7-carboxy-7-deazaguanine synthase QueE [Elusimicrobia bacterium]|jgi:7-carboxy-7-deazaguanine synthase|nr:7-carboxy-7-deazaguanine synthase QueE [Elusimicrobiota bacterium]
MTDESPPLTEFPAPPLGRVAEIFSTLQGEGLHVGQRQVFVRLAGCPWRCRYCDTPNSLGSEGHPTLSLPDVLEKVKALQAVRDHSAVSVTGGEPLMQSEFLSALLPAIRSMGLRTYLETSATHPHLFRSLAPLCDVVAADIKLPSAIGRALWAEHEEFLRLAGDRVFVKIVLTAQTTEDELEMAVNLLSRLTPVPPLVLQPVTLIGDLEGRLLDAESVAPVQILPPPPARLVGFWDWARQRIPVVKLVPQMHPIWGLP